jgi:predicted kinase
VSPDEPQGAVVQAAKGRARELLRRGKPFVWNATNISRRLRGPLIDLFAGYRARVRIVYLDAPFDTILARNRARPSPVPERAIVRMLEKVELPDATEAHAVDYVCTG